MPQFVVDALNIPRDTAILDTRNQHLRRIANGLISEIHRRHQDGYAKHDKSFTDEVVHVGSYLYTRVRSLFESISKLRPQADRPLDPARMILLRSQLESWAQLKYILQDIPETSISRSMDFIDYDHIEIHKLNKLLYDNKEALAHLKPHIPRDFTKYLAVLKEKSDTSKANAKTRSTKYEGQSWHPKDLYKIIELDVEYAMFGKWLNVATHASPLDMRQAITDNFIDLQSGSYLARSLMRLRSFHSINLPIQDVKLLSSIAKDVRGRVAPP